MQLSKFGQKFTADSGILQLMDDLGVAMARGGMLMMGGGNPAYIPQVQAHFRQRMERLLDSENDFERMLGNYAPPQGDADFINALVNLLRHEYGWDVHPENIALTNGSQTSFFILFNMLAGEFADGSHKKILLPLAPEYIGYADVGLTDGLFIAHRPQIEYLDHHLFKYHIDFDAITISDDISAICVSRPTNPTGNVLTDAEIEQLSALAQTHHIPLIIDNAYGTPFPHIIFTNARPLWNDNTIVCMSLSKVGLPATRTGIVIASPEIISAISAINAISSLTPGSLGAVLALDLMRSREIIPLSREVIQPFYRRKAEQAVAQLQQELNGYEFYIHKPEGAIFLWVWFKNLPITSLDLYERLKARRALVVPGHYFFPGLEKDDWRHKQECIRVNYAQDEAIVREGLHIIAEEIKRIYQAR